MSVDHKPGRKGESRRILRSGGYLDRTDPQNPRVICDSLNVRVSPVLGVWIFSTILSVALRWSLKSVLSSNKDLDGNRLFKMFRLAIVVVMIMVLTLVDFSR